MFFIPGILISIVTFPGVIVHELAHQLFCRLCKVPVYEVKYFQFKNPVGYVLHEASDKPGVNFIISIGPFIINTVLGALLALSPAVNLIGIGGSFSLPDVILIYLGFSVLMHAFPSSGDAKAMYESIIKNKNVNIFIKILVFPVIGLIYIGTFGSVVWLDAAYAYAIISMVPNIIVSML